MGCFWSFFFFFLGFVKILSKVLVFSWLREIKWIMLPLFQVKKRLKNFIDQGLELVYVTEK